MIASSLVAPRVRARGWLALGALLGACTASPTPDASTLLDASDASDLGVAESAAPDAPVDTATDAGDAGDAGDAAPLRLRISAVDTRFVLREHMLAAFEMQQSGEPLAQAMGRNLAGFDRVLLPVDRYADPTAGPDGGAADPVLDLVGFSTAVESYEYSKQPMTNVALESGAGTSLAYGPLVNPAGLTGHAATLLLRDRIQRYGIASHLGVRPAAGMAPTGYFRVPAPDGDPSNLLGWRGLWPTLQPFRSFDPALTATFRASGGCSITPGDGDEGRGGVPAQRVTDYECDYTTLNLRARATQVEPVLTPGSTGWAAWKYALWITNFLQIMHDAAGNSIGSVAESELAQVGREGNTVVGTTSNPVGPEGPGGVGTWLGSSDIEGFQAATMLDALDNAAWQWTSQLSTVDGRTLGGFASVRDALAYDYNAPLRWLPGRVAVAESAEADFARPTAYTIASPDSSLLDLLGMLGAYSQLFALSDTANADVGGSQPTRAYLDGEPFALDNQLADGEATLHDRSLALLKLLFVSMDRLHRDPGTELLVDTVTFAGATPTRGATVDTRTAAYAVVSLRALRRALTSHLTLYSNSTPDTAATSTLLDGTSFAGSPGNATLAARLQTLLRAQCQLLLERLTTADGHALPGYNLATQAPTSSDDTLDAHAAAVRGLLEAFLATGDTRFRDRAAAVYARLETVFFHPALRVYLPTPVASWRGTSFTYDPLRFALLQSALREMYKLVGAAPGMDALGAQLQARLARLHKLVLNGWDDRNDDGAVQWPDECLRTVDGLPRGGLQMAERALTGETGLALDGRSPTADREQDCVPEVGHVGLPAALADSITFSVQP